LKEPAVPRTPDRDWVAHQIRLFIVILGSITSFTMISIVGATIIFANDFQSATWPWAVCFGVALSIAVMGAVGGMRN
jgi:hypothetical protein